jgi:general secretion pathway protein E
VNAPDVVAPPLTRADVARARAAAAASGRSVYAELETASGLEPRAFVQALGALLRLDVVETADMLTWRAAVDLLPLPKALQSDCMLFRSGDGALVAVVPDPFELDLQDWLGALGGGEVEPCIALRADIQAYLTRLEQSARAMDSLPTADGGPHADDTAGERLSISAISADESEIVRLVNATLYDAIREGASDIHLRAVRDGMTIKYRIDGVLGAALPVQGRETAERVVSRLKVMAGLDIAEHRVPQDGKLKVNCLGRAIDVRVSIMPTLHGEDAVLRVLDKRSIIPADGMLRLDVLGIDAHALGALRRLVAQPYGMVLVTGPTGSGKTTTLYAAISEINSGRENFLTIEDPVEYELPGVAQIPVNEAQGLTFERGLRSILRHDPDRIMVGEIRDRETAEMAVQAALTGHLVLATVHANNAYDVFNRFTYLGIDMYALTSALNGIVAQRLLRTVCRHCAREQAPADDECSVLQLDPLQWTDRSLVHGQGCGDCRGTGYKGRKAIAEILVLNDRLRRMIAERCPIGQLKAEARSTGTRFLREVALELALRGETTLEEVARVTVQA